DFRLNFRPGLFRLSPYAFRLMGIGPENQENSHFGITIVSDSTNPKSKIQNPKSEEWQPYPYAQRNLTFHLAAHAFRLLFWRVGSCQMIGRENLPKTGGALLTANHASYLDPPLIGSVLYGYRRVWFMGKSEMWNSRLLGFFNDRVGGFP